MLRFLPLVSLAAVHAQTLCDITGYSATYTETIVDDETRNIVTSGCPNHDNTCIAKKGTCSSMAGVSYNITQSVVMTNEYNIPLYPCISDSDGAGYDTTCDGGDIGVMLNGVSIFSQTAADEACSDAVIEEGRTFNLCGGHANSAGAFHYHVAPACLLFQLDDHDDVNANLQHSPHIGWSMDGFPIYGPHGVNGEYIYQCTDDRADADDCLDDCNGHRHTLDGFIYHYHVTGPIGNLQGLIHEDALDPLPESDMYPYTLGCYRGVPSNGKKYRELSCVEDGWTEDYTAEAIEGILDIYPFKIGEGPDYTAAPISADEDAGDGGKKGSSAWRVSFGGLGLLALLSVSSMF